MASPSGHRSVFFTANTGRRDSPVSRCHSVAVDRLSSPTPGRYSPMARPHSSPGEALSRVLDASTTSEDESVPLLGRDGEGEGVTAVYPQRWYLLLLLSFVAMLQTMQWASWGPIAESTELVFGWDDSDIAMTLWMGNLPFALLCIPLSWVMDYKGLRPSVLITCAFMAGGSGLRCLLYFLPSSSGYNKWLVYGGQLLNGVAGPVAQGGQALFSNMWFPPNQRATATAITTFIGYMGSATAFVLGPHLVPDVSSTSGNGSDLISERRQLMDSNGSAAADYSAQKDGIMSYLYYQALASATLLVLVVAYFPDKPAKPPSLSAAVEREEFRPGLKLLVRNKQFWLISAAFCLSLGVFEVWDVVLDVNLGAVGISQESAGWLGFYCIIAGCLTGLVICRLADIFFRQIRLFLILSYVVSAIFMLWFILIYTDILPFDMVSIYAAVILGGVFLDGSSPLVYELICEAAYPVGEGVSCSFLQMLFTLSGMLFTSVLQIPNVGTVWMNWCLFACICLAIPMLLLASDTFGRNDLDMMEDSVVVEQPPINAQSKQREAVAAPDNKTEDLLPDLLAEVHFSGGQLSSTDQTAIRV